MTRKILQEITEGITKGLGKDIEILGFRHVKSIPQSRRACKALADVLSDNNLMGNFGDRRAFKRDLQRHEVTDHLQAMNDYHGNIDGYMVAYYNRENYQSGISIISIDPLTSVEKIYIASAPEKIGSRLSQPDANLIDDEIRGMGLPERK